LFWTIEISKYHKKFSSKVDIHQYSAGLVLVVFDITNRECFKRVPRYIERVRDVSHDQARIVLIGNKIDLRDNCKVSRE